MTMVPHYCSRCGSAMDGLVCPKCLQKLKALQDTAEQGAAVDMSKCVDKEFVALAAQSREKLIDRLEWLDRHDGFDEVSDRKSTTIDALQRELLKREQRYEQEKFERAAREKLEHGKRPTDRELMKGNTPNGQKCEHCGHECVDNCLACGAPQCCPRCCMAATTEAGDELTANLSLMLYQAKRWADMDRSPAHTVTLTMTRKEFYALLQRCGGLHIR